MPVGYRNHHYVPQWYQKRFLEPASTENVLHYLSLGPRSIVDASGRRRVLPARRRRPIRQCFVEQDLYTIRLRGARSSVIEELLFGVIDDRGNDAVAFWGDFSHPSMNQRAIFDLLLYMSTQKLRTPKGLDWLTQQLPLADANDVLRAMTELRNLYSSIWAECVWQLADASECETKFIVSDHPVTVYNRACGPRHQWCRGANDPDIRLHGSHTLFPLGLDRVLILTNLSWARNPYQPPTTLRPNPAFMRDTFFNIFSVQTQRRLREDEVRQINFITKSRAYHYIAAAKEEWLYPEQFVSKSDWATYGHGYLLMPDPRALHHGGEIVMEFADGSTDSFDSYGRKPWDDDFGIERPSRAGRDPLLRFQGEFARLIGPDRRGRSFEAGRLDGERDSDEFHQHHLDLEHSRTR